MVHEAASPFWLLLLALVVIADWLDTAPVVPPWAEDDDSPDEP